MDKKIFVKISIEEKLPTKEDFYFVIKIFHGLELKGTEFFNGKRFDSAMVTHWLEEIPETK